MSFLFPSQPKLTPPPPPPTAAHNPSPSGTASSYGALAARGYGGPGLTTLATLGRKAAVVSKRSLYSVF